MDGSADTERCSHRWWLVLAIAFLVSLLPPIVFHWRNVPDIIEPLRFAGMLLPIDLLLFRWLGELSHWIPVILIVVAVLAKRFPAKAKSIICGGVFLAAVFSTIYAAYSVMMASVYIEGYTRAERRAQEAERNRAGSAEESQAEGVEKLDPGE